MAKPSPQAFADQLLEHTVDLARLEAGTQRQVRVLLEAANKELIATLYKTDPTAPKAGSWQRKRLEVLQEQFAQVLKQSYKKAKKTTQAVVDGVAELEAATVLKFATETLEGVAFGHGLTASRLTRLLDDLIVQGAPAAEWWERQAGAYAQQLKDTLRQSLTLSETLAEMAARVQALSPMKVHDAEALVATSIQSVANATREAVYSANDDVVEGLQWLTTLDARACLQCIPLSALIWTLDDKTAVKHGKAWPGRPPLHFRCRCVLIPVLHGVPSVADQNYAQWFAKLPQAKQLQILGPQRFALWQAGQFPLTSLTDQHHAPLTLSDLKKQLATGPPVKAKVLKASPSLGAGPVGTEPGDSPPNEAAPLPGPQGLRTRDPALLEDADARAVFVQSLGGSTGATLNKGTDGIARVVKKPPDPLQSYVEATTNRLYRELGLAAPESALTLEKGVVKGVANEYLPGGKLLKEVGITKDVANELLDGFVADVWTLNRDALGLELDNVLLHNGKLVRIDNGGALLFRAQGAKKPDGQLYNLLEWEGLVNPALNKNYARLFQAAGLQDADALGARAIKQIEDILDLRQRSDNFERLLPEAPGISTDDRVKLLGVLQRRAELLEREILPRLKNPPPKYSPREGYTLLPDARPEFSDDSKQAFRAWDVRNFGENARERFQVTPQEARAVGDYKGIGYDAINGQARRKKPPLQTAATTEGLDPRVNAMDRLIARTGLTEKTRMWRGFGGFPGAEYLWDLPAADLAGMEVWDDGFYSVSGHKDVSVDFMKQQGARSGKYGLYELYLEPGTRGVTPYNIQGKGNQDYEGELILERLTRFRIVSVRDVPAQGTTPAHRQFVLELVEAPQTAKPKRTRKKQE
jgi:SPP1 gp7 family putative phage head morphogenesis protein